MGTTSQKSNFKIFYAVSLAWQLGFLVAIPLGGFILLGLWGDTFFDTRPLLLIMGVVVGSLITGYEVYHLLLPVIKDKNQDA